MGRATLRFERYVGIDYSGAETPSSRFAYLHVCGADQRATRDLRAAALQLASARHDAVVDDRRVPTHLGDRSRVKGDFSLGRALLRQG